MEQNLSETQLLSLLRGFYIVGDATNLKILYELERYGEKTFSELRDGLHINPATLSKKLRLLTQFGLVSSDKTHDHLRVYYSIANHQKSLRRVLDAIERLSGDLS